MGRPERPLDPAAGPIQAFAGELRKLRQEAGNPKYLQMQRLTGRSRTSLAEAAGGDHLATWETVEAYVRACGGDLAMWERRWTDTRDALRVQRQEIDTRDIVAASRPKRPPSSPLIPWIITALLSTVAVSAAAVIVYSSPAVIRGKSVGSIRSRPPIVVVQNKVATGPSALTEDSTPAYLSAKPIPFCSEEHCEIPKTQMGSGAVLRAICTVRGAKMTNENLHSAGITRNKGGVISSLWYRVEMPNGTTGYLSEVYVARAYRGGLGLPTCPA